MAPVAPSGKTSHISYALGRRLEAESDKQSFSSRQILNIRGSGIPTNSEDAAGAFIPSINLGIDKYT